MDRFIDEPAAAPASAAKHLKSNMDRFIVLLLDKETLKIVDLKSNMDRFIGVRIKYIKSK